MSYLTKQFIKLTIIAYEIQSCETYTVLGVTIGSMQELYWPGIKPGPPPVEA